MMRDLNDLQFFAAVVQNRGFSAARACARRSQITNKSAYHLAGRAIGEYGYSIGQHGD